MSQEPTKFGKHQIENPEHLDMYQELSKAQMGEPKELTDGMILDNFDEVLDFPELYRAAVAGARWAKEQSDAYWKAREVEESEKAFKAGQNYANYLHTTTDYGDDFKCEDCEQYINQLKERLK